MGYAPVLSLIDYKTENVEKVFYIRLLKKSEFMPIYITA